MQNTAITLAIRMMSTIQAKMSNPDMATSTGRLRFREFPTTVQDFGARPVEPHGVIPALHDRQAVGQLAVAAAKLDGDRAVGAFLRGDIVDRVGVVRVFLVIALLIVKADGPEAVDWHVLDVELVDRVAIVPLGRDVEVDRVLVRVAAPGRGRSDQMADRIDLLFGTERLLEIGNCRGKNKKR